MLRIRLPPYTPSFLFERGVPMDNLILSVVTALGIGADIEQIHDAIIAKGWSEDEAFLAIKAGEILYQGRVEREQNEGTQTEEAS